MGKIIDMEILKEYVIKNNDVLSNLNIQERKLVLEESLSFVNLLLKEKETEAMTEAHSKMKKVIDKMKKETDKFKEELNEN